MAVVTQADVEQTVGHKLSWWDRMGFWWEAATAKEPDRGLLADQNNASYGEFQATGDVADILGQAPSGQLGADIGQMSITFAEQASKHNWLAIGITSSVVLAAVYIYGKLS